MSDFSGLDSMIAALHSVEGPALEKATAVRAASLLDARVKATARAGKAPDGTPWKDRKAGGQALAHAYEHISTSAHGSLVRQTLTGPDVFHHFGATRGGVRRQIIPDGGAEIPAVAISVMNEAARAEVAARLGAA